MREAAAELKQLGVPLEVMGPWAAVEAVPEEVELVLPEDCRPPVLAFLRAATQWTWITPGMGRPFPIGFNYPGVEASLRMAGVPCTPELFADLRLMERAALPLLARD